MSRIRIRNQELVIIADIIRNLPEFIDSGERAWRLNFYEAGLKELAKDFNFTGSPKEVAYSVISRLKEYEPLSDLPQDSVLGRLLWQIQSIPEMEPADKAVIRTVIKTQNLAPSFFKD